MVTMTSPGDPPRGVALAAQSDGLPFFDADGDGDVQRPSRRQGDADRPAVRNCRQGNRDRDANVFPPSRLTAGAGAAGAEQLRQDVRIDRTAFRRKPAAAEVEIAEIAAASSARLAAKTETVELGRPRLALRVDLAAVEGLALLVVAEDFVGGPDFGEALLGFRFLTLVGMVFLGELAERGFDFRPARRLRNAKNIIGITHYRPVFRPRLFEKRKGQLSPFSIWPFAPRRASPTPRLLASWRGPR